MAKTEDRLALERLENLITGFGWKISNTQYLDDKIVVTVEKENIAPAELPPAGED